MANSTLQSLFRYATVRRTDRTVFVQALSRLSYPKDRKAEEEPKAAKQAEKAA
mgnify:CR=1 FL=1